MIDPTMKTYYFLATVSNATAQAVRTLAFAKQPHEAFASAAIALSNAGLCVTSMQTLTEEQYYAPNNAPLSYHVHILTPVGYPN